VEFVIDVSVSKDLLRRIDIARGDVPRSTWARAALEDRFYVLRHREMAARQRRAAQEKAQLQRERDQRAQYEAQQHSMQTPQHVLDAYEDA
jgi:hypothetical protein